VQSHNVGVKLDKKLADTWKDTLDWFAELPKAFGELLLLPFEFILMLFYEFGLGLFFLVGFSLTGIYGLFTGALW
jgi:hypothetical protein